MRITHRAAGKTQQIQISLRLMLRHRIVNSIGQQRIKSAIQFALGSQHIFRISNAAERATENPKVRRVIEVGVPSWNQRQIESACSQMQPRKTQRFQHLPEIRGDSVKWQICSQYFVYVRTQLDEFEQLRIDDQSYVRFRIRSAQLAKKRAHQNQISKTVLPDHEDIFGVPYRRRSTPYILLLASTTVNKRFRVNRSGAW